MSDIVSDDILQIFATDQDLSFSDNTKTSNESLDNVVLKLYTKGSNLLPPAAKLAEFLIDQKKLNICGLSFKSNSVLFEISNNSQLNSWLVKLFEERHTNMKLSAESKLDILRICKGKLNLLINQSLVFLVIISGSSAITIPCQNNFHPYGLCNNDIVNVSASSLRDEPCDIIFNFLKFRDDTNLLDIKSIYGIRLEWNDDTDTYNLRFLLKRSNITDRLLCTLKDLYGPVTFLSATFHIIPTILKFETDHQLASGREYSDVWTNIGLNDIILSEVNEMSIIDKASKITNRLTNDSAHPSTSNRRPAVNKNRHGFSYRTATSSRNSEILSRSIFDRLMPKETTLTERMNSSMGFRPVSVHNNRQSSSPKIKSVVGKIKNHSHKK